MLGRKIMHERRKFDLPVWYGNINNDNNYIYPSGVATPFSIDFFGCKEKIYGFRYNIFGVGISCNTDI